MLEDLRTRDERGREQQSRFLKETGDYQTKISQLSRDFDHCKNDLQTHKRRVSELETYESDLKRYKQSDREKEIQISRYDAENKELRKTYAEMMQEREVLRRENMQMEGELALLRAEKQLQDARKSVVSG